MEGIEPDIEIELDDGETVGNYLDQDNQLQKAIEVLKEKMN